MLVLIHVHSICIIFLFRYKYSASLQHQRNWRQPPLPIARRIPRSNGGSPVLAPMVALLFWRVLMSVRPTPIPPTSHPVHPPHPSHPASNHPAHKRQCLLIQPIRYDPIQTIQYDPAANTIQSSQYDTIKPTIRYNPAGEADGTIWSSFSSDQKDLFKTHPWLPHCLSIQILHRISCWCSLI